MDRECNHNVTNTLRPQFKYQIHRDKKGERFVPYYVGRVFRMM